VPEIPGGLWRENDDSKTAIGTGQSREEHGVSGEGKKIYE
jgi:hypothetical protein